MTDEVQCLDCKKWVMIEEIVGDMGICLECYEKALESL